MYMFFYVITEHAETLKPFSFKYPLEVAAAISCEFQKEFLFMAPVGDLPHSTFTK